MTSLAGSWIRKTTEQLEEAWNVNERSPDDEILAYSGSTAKCKDDSGCEGCFASSSGS
ncbi:hypothetical protein DVH05_002849 [Phytophthora capsici]|nr:hypothetical protein DVH05_002848 [Phytophthora capsici]KAG1689080.1 hypothetical protein DVH05_002849 [Phytophthora capsici]